MLCWPGKSVATLLSKLIKGILTHFTGGRERDEDVHPGSRGPPVSAERHPHEDPGVRPQLAG